MAVAGVNDPLIRWIKPIEDRQHLNRSTPRRHRPTLVSKPDLHRLSISITGDDISDDRLGIRGSTSTGIRFGAAVVGIRRQISYELCDVVNEAARRTIVTKQFIYFPLV